MKAAIGCYRLLCSLGMKSQPKMSLIDHASYRAEMTDTETRSLTEMEVGTGGGLAVSDFLHRTEDFTLTSPHLTLTIWDQETRQLCYVGVFVT